VTTEEETAKTGTSRLGTAALIVSAGVLLSRVLGLVRNIIVANILGADAISDTYVAAFRIPDFTNYLLAGGFLSITFIPIFTKYLADDDEAGGWSAFSSIARWAAVAMVLLIVVAWVIAEPVVEWLFPTFDATQVAETVRNTRIILPAQLFFILGSLLMAVQYAKGSFAIPSMAPIIYNLGIIIGGVVGNLGDGPGSTAPFMWGVLGGSLVGNFGLQIYGARRHGMQLAGTTWDHPAVRQYVTMAIPLMVGQSIAFFDEFFSTKFGTDVGPGAATQIEYARRTMLVPVGAIAQAASVAAYPTLSRLFNEKREEAMSETLSRSIQWVTVLSIGGTILMAMLARPIISLLYERGRFDAEDAEAAGLALAVYALAIPLWGILQLVTRGFYARRQMWEPVLIGTATTLIAIPLYNWAADQYGVRGVAMASVMTLALYTGVLAWRWYEQQGWVFFTPVMKSVGRALPLGLLAGAVAWLANWIVAQNLDQTGTYGALTIIIATTAAFGITAVAAGGVLAD
jgi:putative peptidoglycan lipid II flippase